MLSVDTRGNSTLVLLDLSLAFDTLVTHTIAIYGLRGLVMMSFLTGLYMYLQSCYIEILRALCCGRCSFLSHILPLCQIIQQFSNVYHVFADDA